MVIKKKKLIYFHYGFEGGLAKTTLMRCRELAHYFDVGYVVPQISLEMKEKEGYQAFLSSGIELNALFRYTDDNIFEDLNIFRVHIEEFLKTKSPDIVILPGLLITSRIFGEVSKKLGVSLVCAEPRAQFSFNKDAENVIFLADIVDAIFPNSEANTNLIKKILPSKFIKTIPNGLLYSDYEESLLENPFSEFVKEGDVVISHVAQIHYQKNQLMFVRSIELLVDIFPNLKAFIVGADASMGQYVRSYIKTKGLDAYIKVLGYRSDIDSVLAHTNIYCLCSYFEGMPKSLLEAMNAGCPVVTTTAPGVDELINDGEDGYKVSPNDSELMSKRLKILITSPSRRLAFGKKAQAKIREKYNLKNICDDYSHSLQNLYDEKCSTKCMPEDKFIKWRLLSQLEKKIPDDPELKFLNDVDFSILKDFPVICFNICIEVILKYENAIERLLSVLVPLLNNHYVFSYLWMVACYQDCFFEKVMIITVLLEDYCKKNSIDIKQLVGLKSILINIIDTTISSKKPLIYYHVASYLKSIGKIKRAIDFFETLNQMHVLTNDMRGGIWFHLGEIYYNLNEKKQALFYFKKAIFCIPDHQKASELICLCNDYLVGEHHVYNTK